MHNKEKNLLKEQLQGLNREQLEAAMHREGPMLVSAGPGSGKTHVIITRLIYMIVKYRIPPEKILVITFTKEAAEAMCSRFHQACENIYACHFSVSFGTFHSIYFQIIKSIPAYSKYHLLRKKEIQYILSQVLMLKNMSREDIEDYIDQYIAAISYYKNTLDLEKAAHMAKLEPEQLHNIIKDYDHEKDRRKQLDFDDMLYLCLKLLQENETILKLWQERFFYYLIDEFQDCNPVQYKILRMLAGKQAGDNIFAVGDDDQAIYGFRGADSKILQRFLTDYPCTKRVTLGINYRCNAQIVKASSDIIRENKLRMEKQLQAADVSEKEGRVTIRKWPSKSHMLQYMRETFEALSKEEQKEHAVLFRTNQEAQMFAAEMARHHISFYLKGQTRSIYEHFIVKDIMAFLEAAWGNRDRKLFLGILNKPRTNIGREALEEEQVDFYKLKAFYENPYMKNPKAVRDVERLEQRLEQLKKLPLSLGIRYVRMAMHYERYLTKRADGNEALLASWFELLDWLQEEAAAYKTPEEWKVFQEEYEQVYGKQEKATKNQGVWIMTMHGSKGLEFEHCYILNINEGTVPKYQKGEKLSIEQIEEERRIFYVAMTRAKKTLELHYLTGTRERPKLPSRFIEKLLH